MKITAGLTFAVPLSILLCHAAEAQEAVKESRVIFPEQQAVVRSIELPLLEREAMQGSIEAAHKLATYYSLIRLNNQEAIFWTQIRMENGDRDARYELGALLAVDDSSLNRIRATYWLRQVISDGPPELSKLAASVIQDMADRDKYRRNPEDVPHRSN